jgi:hypothetical protein
MIQGEDILVIIKVLEAVMHAFKEENYNKVYDKIKSQILKGSSGDFNLMLNSYDIYWMKKACNIVLPMADKLVMGGSEADRLMLIQQLTKATEGLNKIKDDGLAHDLDDGHQRIAPVR